MWIQTGCSSWSFLLLEICLLVRSIYICWMLDVNGKNVSPKWTKSELCKKTCWTQTSILNRLGCLRLCFHFKTEKKSLSVKLFSHSSLNPLSFMLTAYLATIGGIKGFEFCCLKFSLSFPPGFSWHLFTLLWVQIKPQSVIFCDQRGQTHTWTSVCAHSLTQAGSDIKQKCQMRSKDHRSSWTCRTADRIGLLFLS